MGYFLDRYEKIQEKKGSSHDAFHFTLQSDQFAHAQQSATFKVEEITKNSERFENYMTTSGESFKSSSKFTADVTFIRIPKGGKSGRQKALVGKRSMAEVLKEKHSVIQMKNSDELCCARAICIEKAWIHKAEGYRQKNRLRERKKM